MTDARETYQRYERVVSTGDEALWEGVSWTVIVDPDSDGIVARHLSEHVEVTPGVTLDRLRDHAFAELGDGAVTAPGYAWLIRGQGWLGLFELGGYVGASREAMLSLSWAGSRVVSVLWNQANGLATAGYAWRGSVEFLELDDLSPRALKQARTLSQTLAPLRAGDFPARRRPTCGPWVWRSSSSSPARGCRTTFSREPGR